MRLENCLLSFTLPFDCLQCTDLVCTNNEHVESVQTLHDNIISKYNRYVSKYSIH